MLHVAISTTQASKPYNIDILMQLRRTMDVRLEPQIEGRRKERVVFTGTILPKTQDRHNSIEHCCEGVTLPRVALKRR